MREDGTTAGDGPAGARRARADALRRGRSHVLEHEGVTIFADVFAPPPRLFVYGAVDTAEALCRAAKLVGWTSVVADARARFATRERLPSADEILVAWPEEAFAQVRPDVSTAVVVLTHDDKFDVPALAGGARERRLLRRRTRLTAQSGAAARRLLEVGVPEDALDRIAGPCGLDIGAPPRRRPRSRCSPRCSPPAPAAPAGRSATPKHASMPSRLRGKNKMRLATPFAACIGSLPCC